MVTLRKTGQLFFGLGILVYGIQQLVIRDFRPQIVPGFPPWAHTLIVFPIVTGVAMIVTGLLLSGLLPVKGVNKRSLSFYLGFYFLALIIASHIPYLLFVYPHKLSHLGSWGDALKELAFCGGAWVMAGSFDLPPFEPAKNNFLEPAAPRLVTLGRFFFCTTIILFGMNHFVYDISGMVPAWFGIPTFWSYFAGAALMASGLAILFKIFLRPVSLLLALMLFLWFIFVHAPNAIAYPAAGRGNSIVSAFDALLFCGTALLLAQVKKNPHGTNRGSTWTAAAWKERGLPV